MSRALRALAQTRNVLIDVARTGSPMRDVVGASEPHTVSAPHSCDYQLLRELFSLFPVRSDDTFVDIGCGFGRVLVDVQRRTPSARVIGLEGEAAACSRARRVQRRYPSIEIIEGWAPEATPAGVSYAFMSNAVPAEMSIRILQGLSNDNPPRQQVVILNPPGEDLIRSHPTIAKRYQAESFTLGGSGLLRGRILPGLHLTLREV